MIDSRQVQIELVRILETTNATGHLIRKYAVKILKIFVSFGLELDKLWPEKKFPDNPNEINVYLNHIDYLTNTKDFLFFKEIFNEIFDPEFTSMAFTTFRYKGKYCIEYFFELDPLFHRDMVDFFINNFRSFHSIDDENLAHLKYYPYLLLFSSHISDHYLEEVLHATKNQGPEFLRELVDTAKEKQFTWSYYKLSKLCSAHYPSWNGAHPAMVSLLEAVPESDPCYDDAQLELMNLEFARIYPYPSLRVIEESTHLQKKRWPELMRLIAYRDLIGMDDKHPELRYSFGINTRTVLTLYKIIQEDKTLIEEQEKTILAQSEEINKLRGG